MEHELARIERALREDPEDPAAWDRLTRAVARAGRLPRLVEERGASVLLRMMARAPEERVLAGLLLASQGWRAVPRSERPPPRAWAATGRLGEGGDHDFDRWTGMPLAIRLDDGDMEFVWVPPGVVRVPPRGRFALRTPVDLAVPAGFFLARVPVTRSQLARRIGARRFRGSAGRDLPAEVGYGEGRELCRALDARRTGTRWLRHDLPTELEWEYACRAGSTALAYASPLSAVAWYSDNSSGGVREVGRLHPNDFGLHDTLGNVWEWCSNTWDDPGGASRGEGVEDGDRPLRGGSWASPPGLVHATMRVRGRDVRAYGSVGVRPMIRLI